MRYAAGRELIESEPRELPASPGQRDQQEGHQQHLDEGCGDEPPARQLVFEQLERDMHAVANAHGDAEEGHPDHQRHADFGRPRQRDVEHEARQDGRQDDAEDGDDQERHQEVFGARQDAKRRNARHAFLFRGRMRFGLHAEPAQGSQRAGR